MTTTGVLVLSCIGVMCFELVAGDDSRLCGLWALTFDAQMSARGCKAVLAPKNLLPT